MPTRKQLPNPIPLIGLISRGYTRIFDARLRQFGFAVGQIPVLVALKGGNALPQAELARLAKVEQPTMAQLLNRMERDGIVDRIPDPADRRSRLISLTAEAEKRMPKARAIMFAGSDEALSGLSDAEVVQLFDLLQKVNANIEKMSEQAEDA
ncbi:MarR family transcriptional regulator [Paraburkholderia sp. D15]|uniref:MarR family winged helix-turn-helix transcriptional regulator n=1 Tax=Paraburkholderia sp. D15 TaxID=2880218 RepID=UPI00247A21F9|nr:MarR family transcriptional regulator [Paraburkholderia sp. D15]WGS52159.1 MarR family transcriptional regulator [Paraburkholderia sp. D15]